jgi:putative transposase
MSWIRIWTHVVFSTKNREPSLQSKVIRDKLIWHIMSNCKEKNIPLVYIGGYDDHLHCLLLLMGEFNLNDMLRHIKGESSHWMNQNYKFKEKFMWQDDFWAVSVSEKHVHLVKNYIGNQEKHHKKRDFNEEINLIAKKTE